MIELNYSHFLALKICFNASRIFRLPNFAYKNSKFPVHSELMPISLALDYWILLAAQDISGENPRMHINVSLLLTSTCVSAWVV